MSDLIDQQQKGTTMSEKYIDLASRISNESGAYHLRDTIIEGVLEWLDEHPDQVPGRTITDAGLGEIWEAAHAGKGIGSLTLALKNNGITVAEPESTNAELIERKLRELREEPGEWMTYATDSDISGFSQALDAKGVKAPGGDDE